MDITKLDKKLYSGYKERILQAMNSTTFNLSRELTELLGPPKDGWTKEMGLYGLIERWAHSSAEEALENDKKSAFRKLNALLKLDPWLDNNLEFKYGSIENANEFNNYYKNNFLLSNESIKKIFPNANGKEARNFYQFNSVERLHIPHKVFVNDKNIYRLKPLIEEIKRNSPKKVSVKGSNFGGNWECLYVLSLTLVVPGNQWEPANGTPNFPDSLKKWFFNFYLDRYCDYCIVVGNYYCHINNDNRFKLFNEFTITRSMKKFSYQEQSPDVIEHILIFDNYQKKHMNKASPGIKHDKSSL